MNGVGTGLKKHNYYPLVFVDPYNKCYCVDPQNQETIRKHISLIRFSQYSKVYNDRLAIDFVNALLSSLKLEISRGHMCMTNVLRLLNFNIYVFMIF